MCSITEIFGSVRAPSNDRQTHAAEPTSALGDAQANAAEPTTSALAHQPRDVILSRAKDLVRRHARSQRTAVVSCARGTFAFGSDTVFGVNAISQEHGSGGRGCMVFQNGRWHRQR